MSKADKLPIVITMNVESARAGAAMLHAGLARAVIYVEDRPGRPGVVDVKYLLAPGQDLAEIENLIAHAADLSDGVVVDPAHLVASGAA